MVTKQSDTRYDYFVKSVAAFRHQTYERRELLIVFDETRPDWLRRSIDHLNSLGDPRIRFLQAPGGLTLGALRNLSVEAADGAIICQWDDDDIHHPDRVGRQVETMRASGAEACYLQEVLQLVEGSRELYWTNWRMTPVGGHPGAMACRRGAMGRYHEDGPEAALGEDAAMAQALKARGAVTMLAGEPHLFVYVTHGSNVSPASHHRMLIDQLAISRSLLLRREAELRKMLASVSLGPGPVQVTGSNGQAFTFEPAAP